MTLLWINNAPKDRVDADIKELCKDNNNRKIVKGEPKPSSTYNVYQLKRMGYIGIYDEIEDKSPPN